MNATLTFGRLLPLYTLFVMFSGCGKKDPDPAPPTGLTGTVSVTSQQGVAQPKGGVTVTVLDVTPALTATTTEAGTFALGAVPAGTHALAFSRPGLSTFVLRGVAHPTATALTRLPDTYRLLQEPTLRVTSLVATAYTSSGGAPGINFRTVRTSPQPSGNSSYVLFFGTTPDVSLLTATSFLTLFGSATPAATTSSSSWSMERRDFERYGFRAPSGTTAYAVAYGFAQFTDHTDLLTGQSVSWPHPNLTPSPVVSFTMP